MSEPVYTLTECPECRQPVRASRHTVEECREKRRPKRMERVMSASGRIHILRWDRTLCGRECYPPDWQVLPRETEADCWRCLHSPASDER